MGGSVGGTVGVSLESNIIASEGSITGSRQIPIAATAPSPSNWTLTCFTSSTSMPVTFTTPFGPVGATVGIDKFSIPLDSTRTMIVSFKTLKRVRSTIVPGRCRSNTISLPLGLAIGSSAFIACAISTFPRPSQFAVGLLTFNPPGESMNSAPPLPTPSPAVLQSSLGLPRSVEPNNSVEFDVSTTLEEFAGLYPPSENAVIVTPRLVYSYLVSYN